MCSAFESWRDLTPQCPHKSSSITTSGKFETYEFPCNQERATEIPPMFQELIPLSRSDHPGAGAALIDEALKPGDLARLDLLRLSLELTAKRPTAKRRFFTDEDGWITSAILAALHARGLTRFENALPWYRFIEYDEGGGMDVHTDGSNQHPDTGRKSQATFLLPYARACMSSLVCSYMH